MLATYLALGTLCRQVGRYDVEAVIVTFQQVRGRGAAEEEMERTEHKFN